MFDDYELSPPDRAYFLHFIVKEDSRQFYNVTNEQGGSLTHLIKELSDRYDSEDKRDKISNNLAHLCLNDYAKQTRNAH